MHGMSWEVSEIRTGMLEKAGDLYYYLIDRNLGRSRGYTLSVVMRDHGHDSFYSERFSSMSECKRVATWIDEGN